MGSNSSNTTTTTTTTTTSPKRQPIVQTEKSEKVPNNPPQPAQRTSINSSPIHKPIPTGAKISTNEQHIDLIRQHLRLEWDILVGTQRLLQITKQMAKVGTLDKKELKDKEFQMFEVQEKFQ